MSAFSGVTERLTLHLKPNADWVDGANRREDLLRLQNGYKRGYWGRSMESKDTVECLLYWDSVEAHHKFLSTPSELAALGKIMRPLFAAPPSLYLVDFVPNPEDAVLKAPVVEMLTFYSLAAEFTMDSVTEFFAVVEGIEGCLGIAKGLSQEDVASEPGGEASGKALVAAIGWTSMEAIAKGQKSEAWMNAPKLNYKMDLHHVTFQEAV